MVDYLFSDGPSANRIIQDAIDRFVQSTKQEFKGSRDVSKSGASDAWVSVQGDDKGWIICQQGKKVFPIGTLANFSISSDSSGLSVTFRSKPASYAGVDGLSSIVFTIQVSKKASTVEGPDKVRTNILFDITPVKPRLEPAQDQTSVLQKK